MPKPPRQYGAKKLSKKAVAFFDQAYRPLKPKIAEDQPEGVDRKEPFSFED